jgi:hypothetical protein
MSELTERVNLRLTAQTFKPFERLAQLATGMGSPTTATQLVRMFVDAQVETVEMLVAAAEAGIRGDVEARDKVFDAILASQEADLQLARAVELAERRAVSPAVVSE